MRLVAGGQWPVASGGGVEGSSVASGGLNNGVGVAVL